MRSSPRLPPLLLLATAVPGFQHPLTAQAPQPKDRESIGVERPKGLHPGVHHKVQSVPPAEKASASEVRQRLATISRDLRTEGKLPLAERIDNAVRSLAHWTTPSSATRNSCSSRRAWPRWKLRWRASPLTCG